jgi:hypothetical protein
MNHPFPNSMRIMRFLSQMIVFMQYVFLIVLTLSDSAFCGVISPLPGFAVKDLCKDTLYSAYLVFRLVGI